jgi:hypothetical protein
MNKQCPNCGSHTLFEEEDTYDVVIKCLLCPYTKVISTRAHGGDVDGKVKGIKVSGYNTNDNIVKGQLQSKYKNTLARGVR